MTHRPSSPLTDMPPAGNRSIFIDLLKAAASQLIVLHHLAFYGPMADAALPLAPGLIGWLDDYGRMAVQVFLVIGGFLAARALAPQGLPMVEHPLSLIGRRFAKLVPPYMVAVLLAVAASALARQWMDHPSISASPTLWQLAAHALLLHDVFGYEALSAGLWYVAIDFQLYALVTLLLLLAARIAPAARWLAPALLAAGMTLSLLHLNRDPDWDTWAPYFLGSYGLGMFAWWTAVARGKAVPWLAMAMLLPALAGLAFDFRLRIAIAVVTALVLLAITRGASATGPSIGLRLSAAIGTLGRISYAVFLVHFPVCLLVNAAFTRFAPAEPAVQAAGMLLAWAASIGAGAIFHRRVEVPLGRLVPSRRH